MEWFQVVSLWYLKLTLIGCIFFPLAHRIFSKTFADKGYAFSKIIGILCIIYTSYVLGTLKIAPFTLSTLALISGAFLVINVLLWRQKPWSLDRNTIKFILFEELLFFYCLVAWTFVRGQEPSLHSLEKFMDFGFMNAVIRSEYFPAHDMWLAGSNINYYYFGHVVGAGMSLLFSVKTGVGYTLILASIFALSIVETFSLAYTLISKTFKSSLSAVMGGLLATFLVNLGGNLHTIYAFTKGYENDKAVPFWQILSNYNPLKYWYPNATRFIPFTIHEFPIYSYIVADLHGHVFDIPFVLLTLAIMLHIAFEAKDILKSLTQKTPKKLLASLMSQHSVLLCTALGCMIGIHYMTNAFDSLVYLFFGGVLLLWIFKISLRFLVHVGIMGASFLASSLPFTLFFKPFGTGVGVNCAPDFLVKMGKFGPFLFEQGKCQHSLWWMLLVLWGFFFFNALFFAILLFLQKKGGWKDILSVQLPGITYIALLYVVGIILLIIPEYIYLKDIYPAHFRANTMFKLGYQAFIMMSIATACTLMYAKNIWSKHKIAATIYIVLLLPQLFLVAIYPQFGIQSYYGAKLDRKVELDGTAWLKSSYPEYSEVIEYLNMHATAHTVILEAQGDSYSDLDIVSSYTGIPTVGGWYVHEWLWRGSSDAVGKLQPDIEEIYKGSDVATKHRLLDKYAIEYVIVGPHENTKYAPVNIESLERVAEKVFVSNNSKASIYRVMPEMRFEAQ